MEPSEIGAIAKENAIASVERNAPEDWKVQALRAGEQVARQMKTFTSDDVMDMLMVQGIEDPPEPRAYGPVMIAIVKRGYAFRTSSFRKSTRASCHHREKRVYESNICQY